MKLRVIPSIEARHKKKDLSWIENEDLVLFLKECNKY